MAKTVEELEKELKKYEENGPAKLYYALNRKAWEMADILNKTNLGTVNLDDPKDKTFDRLKVLWNDSSSLSQAIEALGKSAGITGDEEKDAAAKRQRTTPESIADVLGDNKQQQA